MVNEILKVVMMFYVDFTLGMGRIAQIHTYLCICAISIEEKGHFFYNLPFFILYARFLCRRMGIRNLKSELD